VRVADAPMFIWSADDAIVTTGNGLTIIVTDAEEEHPPEFVPVTV